MYTTQHISRKIFHGLNYITEVVFSILFYSELKYSKPFGTNLVHSKSPKFREKLYFSHSFFLLNVFFIMILKNFLFLLNMPPKIYSGHQCVLKEPNVLFWITYVLKLFNFVKMSIFVLLGKKSSDHVPGTLTGPKMIEAVN